MNLSIAGIADVKELNLLINSAYRGETSKKGWTTEADLLDGIRTTEQLLTDVIKQPGAEQNNITRAWNFIGIANKTAGDSQSLIELKKQYCDKKRCLDCAVGNTLLKRNA